MGLLTTVKKGFNSLLGGAKVTLDQTSSGLKNSVEQFIADMVIRKTFDSLKGALLNSLEDSSSPASLAQESEQPAADAVPTITSSNDLMTKLMGNFSGPLKQAAEKMATQVGDTFTNAGDEISRGVKRTVKSTIEGIKADDIVSGLSHFLNGSLQKLSGEEGSEDKKEGENLNFNLNGTIQMLGWFSIAIGALLLTGLNQGILNSEPVQEAPSLSF